MTRVKICGITNLDDALAACDAGADALGFVFAPEAKARNRYIEPDSARAIVEELPPWIATVGVCVNETVDRMLGYLQFLDSVQLCGDETAETCNALGARAIKAFHVGVDFPLDSLRAFGGKAWLLDACVAGQRGGSGTTCDWSLAQAATQLGKPIILAGGLTPDNVGDAVRIVRPYAVDTSGGVESAPGKKDHERIRAFIRNARVPLP